MATKSTTNQNQSETNRDSSWMKRLGAHAAIAAAKTPDIVVGWRAGNSEEVQAAIAAYNDRAVSDYKAQLLAELGL